MTDDMVLFLAELLSGIIVRVSILNARLSLAELFSLVSVICSAKL
jgi:hypothetical protein